MRFFSLFIKSLQLGALCALGVGLAIAPAAAESAWVGSRIQLNLRTGPGTEYRIIGSVETGDPVKILDRKTKWTRVRLAGGQTGWIPVGYLEPKPPPVLELSKLRKEVDQLRVDRNESRVTLARLEKEAQSHTETESEQRQRIETLMRTNMELEAGARWPEGITGAAILCSGLALGALLQRASTRRRQGSRIKL